MTDKELNVVMDILDDIINDNKQAAADKLSVLQKNYKITEKFKSPYVGK